MLGGLFKHLTKCLEELGCGCAVDPAVIAGETHNHALSNDDTPMGVDDGLLYRCAYREDGSVRCVDNAKEATHAIHAEVSNGERRSRHLCRCKFLRARFCNQGFSFKGNVAQ